MTRLKTDAFVSLRRPNRLRRPHARREDARPAPGLHAGRRAPSRPGSSRAGSRPGSRAAGPGRSRGRARRTPAPPAATRGILSRRAAVREGRPSPEGGPRPASAPAGTRSPPSSGRAATTSARTVTTDSDPAGPPRRRCRRRRRRGNSRRGDAGSGRWGGEWYGTRNSNRNLGIRMLSRQTTGALRGERLPRRPRARWRPGASSDPGRPRSRGRQAARV